MVTQSVFGGEQRLMLASSSTAMFLRVAPKAVTFACLSGFCAEQLKELHILGVGAGVARLDIVHLKIVENARNLDFILYGKGDANALRAVAQR